MQPLATTRHTGSLLARSLLESLELLLTGLDPLLIATGLALTSLTPGPAGEAGAVAAIGYDIARKKWFGVVLSATSMVPVFGYIPAALKLGLLLFEVNQRLKSLVTMAPEIRSSPEALNLVRLSLGKYYRQLPNIRLLRTFRKQLERILSFDECGHALVDPPRPESSTETSISTKSPK